MGRSRIVIEQAGFCRNVADVISLREAVLARNYWPYSIEIERLQLSLSAKVFILRSSGGGVYEIQYDVSPEGFVNVA